MSTRSELVKQKSIYASEKGKISGLVTRLQNSSNQLSEKNSGVGYVLNAIKNIDDTISSLNATKASLESAIGSLTDRINAIDEELKNKNKNKDNEDKDEK